MFKKIIFIIAASSALFAETEKTKPVQLSFPFLEVGVETGYYPWLPGLSFGGGYRKQSDKQGYEFSANISTSVVYTHIKGKGLCLFYPKPFVDSEAYLGFGIGGGLYTVMPGCGDFGVFVSPELAVGKQYRNSKEKDRFWEIGISWPYLYGSFDHHSSEWYPLEVLLPRVGFRYGF